MYIYIYIYMYIYIYIYIYISLSLYIYIYIYIYIWRLATRCRNSGLQAHGGRLLSGSRAGLRLSDEQVCGNSLSPNGGGVPEGYVLQACSVSSFYGCLACGKLCVAVTSAIRCAVAYALPRMCAVPCALHVHMCVCARVTHTLSCSTQTELVVVV